MTGDVYIQAVQLEISWHNFSRVLIGFGVRYAWVRALAESVRLSEYMPGSCAHVYMSLLHFRRYWVAMDSVTKCFYT